MRSMEEQKSGIRVVSESECESESDLEAEHNLERTDQYVRYWAAADANENNAMVASKQKDLRVLQQQHCLLRTEKCGSRYATLSALHSLLLFCICVTASVLVAWALTKAGGRLPNQCYSAMTSSVAILVYAFIVWAVAVYDSRERKPTSFRWSRRHEHRPTTAAKATTTTTTTTTTMHTKIQKPKVRVKRYRTIPSLVCSIILDMGGVACTSFLLYYSANPVPDGTHTEPGIVPTHDIIRDRATCVTFESRALFPVAAAVAATSMRVFWIALFSFFGLFGSMLFKFVYEMLRILAQFCNMFIALYELSVRRILYCNYTHQLRTLVCGSSTESDSSSSSSGESGYRSTDKSNGESHDTRTMSEFEESEMTMKIIYGGRGRLLFLFLALFTVAFLFSNHMIIASGFSALQRLDDIIVWASLFVHLGMVYMLLVGCGPLNLRLVYMPMIVACTTLFCGILALFDWRYSNAVFLCVFGAAWPLTISTCMFAVDCLVLFIAKVVRSLVCLLRTCCYFFFCSCMYCCLFSSLCTRCGCARCIFSCMENAEMNEEKETHESSVTQNKTTPTLAWKISPLFLPYTDNERAFHSPPSHHHHHGQVSTTPIFEDTRMQQDDVYVLQHDYSAPILDLTHHVKPHRHLRHHHHHHHPSSSSETKQSRKECTVGIDCGVDIGNGIHIPVNNNNNTTTTTTATATSSKPAAVATVFNEEDNDADDDNTSRSSYFSTPPSSLTREDSCLTPPSRTLSRDDSTTSTIGVYDDTVV